MRSVAIIQARISSTRLPGKVLKDLGHLSVLGWCVRAAQAIPGIDAVAVATSEDAGDDRIAAWCAGAGITCVRGPLNDVLARFVLAARETKAQIIMRLTADCPLLDPHVCGEVLALFRRSQSDYASNCTPRTWPDGTDCEVFTAESLYRAEAESLRACDREHVTPFIRNNQYRFRVTSLSCPLPGLGTERWTLDTPEDFVFLSALVKLLPRERAPSYLEVLAALEAHPDLRNATPQAAFTPVTLDSPPPSYSHSQLLLPHAESVIPQGSQTYSKSARQFPLGHTPLFVTHGDGAHVWDVDGNRYVDLVCGLLPVVLGYADPEVDYAIREQLTHGITFSLPTVLEAELARRMQQMIPCADKVRFAKNGSDATSACIRLARAHTGREDILVCGYHGWHDWYIGTTSRYKGVPASVSALTHQVAYNDLAALERMLIQHKGEVAALMMEPVSAVLPQPGYLADVKALLHKHGALLIFDEVITGFRVAKGGAQDYFGVTPDLAAFGKAMGNGMPISAVTGREDVMAQLDHIFFSGTFGGEALSLAAAIAVIDKMQREPVIDTLWKHGEELRSGVDMLLRKHGMDHVIVQKGLAPWVILDFLPQETARKEAVKTLFIAQMARYGVLVIGAHNVCYALTDADKQHVLAAYDHTLAHIASELATGELEQRLPHPVIFPAFTVR